MSVGMSDFSVGSDDPDVCEVGVVGDFGVSCLSCLFSRRERTRARITRNRVRIRGVLLDMWEESWRYVDFARLVLGLVDETVAG